MAKAVDLTGQTFGTWTVVGRVENSRARVARFRCVCACGSGRERILESTKLRHPQPGNVCGTCQCDAAKPGKGRPTLRQVAADELRALYEDEGVTSTQIGKRLGVSAAVVLLWLREAGIVIRKTADSRRLSGGRRIEYQCQRCGRTCETFRSQPRKTCGRGCPGCPGCPGKV